MKEVEKRGRTTLNPQHPKSAEVTRVILCSVDSGRNSTKQIEMAIRHLQPYTFYPSRMMMRERIAAEVAFGRLESSPNGYVITDQGKRRLAELQKH